MNIVEARIVYHHHGHRYHQWTVSDAPPDDHANCSKPANVEARSGGDTTDAVDILTRCSTLIPAVVLTDCHTCSCCPSRPRHISCRQLYSPIDLVHPCPVLLLSGWLLSIGLVGTLLL